MKEKESCNDYVTTRNCRKDHMAKGFLGVEVPILNYNQLVLSDTIKPRVPIEGLDLFQGQKSVTYNLCNCVDDYCALDLVLWVFM